MGRKKSVNEVGGTGGKKRKKGRGKGRKGRGGGRGGHDKDKYMYSSWLE